MAIRLSGLASGMDTEGMVTELMKAQRMKTTKLQNKITTLEWTKEKWSGLNTKFYSFYTGALSKLRFQSSFNVMKASSSNEAKVEVTAGTTAPEGTHSIEVKQLASAQFVTGSASLAKSDGTDISGTTKLVDLGFKSSEGTTINIQAGTKTTALTIGDGTTIDDFVKKLRDVGLNANYDTAQKRFFISSKQSGTDNAFTITTSSAVTNNLSMLGLSEIKKETDGSISYGSNVKLVQPANAKVVYNGAELTSSSNTITANGLTFTVKGLTTGLDPLDPADDEKVNLNVSNNTQAVYDMVKGFVKKYNELMTEMNDSYGAASAKGFAPLTDDEKATMSETQIDKWEDKIKTSLLRRDSNLNTLIDSMRSSVNSNVEVDGKRYSLSSFGIASTSYTEKGLLHIDGDADESITSGKENKLMNALNTDPDKVAAVITELAGNLFSEMTKNMKSSTMRSALTLYNDKEINKNITDYQSDLSGLEKRLKKMEDGYYKQFSAMETAMNKMNSQSSSLAAMLGTGSK